MPDLKHIALEIFRETLARVDIPETVRRSVSHIGRRLSISGHRGEIALDLEQYNRIRVVAIGKASISMTRGLTSALAPAVPIDGIIVTPRDVTPGDATSLAFVSDAGVHEVDNCLPANGHMPDILSRFRTIRAGHPVPDENSVIAGREILQLLQNCDARTLVFFLLSGGGSALVELPLTSTISLDEFGELTRLLITCGAGIEEINAVRKHLSAVKGGRLAAAAPAATKVTLAVSDVPAGRESALASGPTLPDPTTVFDACRIIERYGLLPKLPASIRAQFERPEEMPETPKPGDPAFALAHFALLCDTDDLLRQAQLAAEAHGCVAVCDNSTDDWPVSKAADYLLGQLSRLHAANAHGRVAVIADGELSVPVTGNGVGGRNCAFVLDCVPKIARHNFAEREIVVLSAGTDGKDGSSPAAGAVANGETFGRAMAGGLDPEDYFRRSDSYTFFQSLGDAIETGPTGNNLRDLRVLIAE